MSRRDRRLGLAVVVVALVGALAPAAPEPLAVNKPLAEEQLKLIDQGLADLDRMLKGGEVGLTDPRFDRWERRRVDALRAAGAGKPAIIAALERYAKRMKDVEGYRKSLFEKDQGTRVETIEARYERLEAEIWLNQEKAR
jgi:hypothetical protein